jgi:predicted TIM-barrel fold metal-dependent hydrolase
MPERHESQQQSPKKIFDAHFHVIDPSFPLIGNDGYFPPTFTVADYLERTGGLGIDGGAVVSGSFQGFDQGYLRESLAQLGSGFVGVSQLPATTSDAEILDLHGAGIRAIRFNLYRGGSETIDQLGSFARRVHELAGWHTELYVDAKDLTEIIDQLITLPALSIDHLGMSAEGLPTLLTLAENGVRVKATGFGRVSLDVRTTLEKIHSVNPDALMFGTDLPSTRARQPFSDSDIDVVTEVIGEAGARKVLRENARTFYRVSQRLEEPKTAKPTVVGQWGVTPDRW